MELDSWCTDKKSWPEKRTYAVFCEWFKIEFHSEVYDFVEGLIKNDDLSDGRF